MCCIASRFSKWKISFFVLTLKKKKLVFSINNCDEIIRAFVWSNPRMSPRHLQPRRTFWTIDRGEKSFRFGKLNNIIITQTCHEMSYTVYYHNSRSSTFFIYRSEQTLLKTRATTRMAPRICSRNRRDWQRRRWTRKVWNGKRKKEKKGASNSR